MWKIIFDGSEEFFAFYLTKKGFEVYIVNESGITSQYGFLFQRKVFVLYVLENMNVKQRFSFEGKDDVEISVDEKIYELDSSESNCVQVKSGKVDKNCFSKVIGNWLLLDCVKSQKYTLFVENELEIDMSMDSIICEMLSFVEKGKSKKAKDNTLPLITTNVLFKPLFSSFQKIFVKKNTLSCIIQAIHKVRMVYPTNCSQFSIASTSTVIPKRVTA